jgi:predicted nuclease of predicted toxin-antitoxin system
MRFLLDQDVWAMTARLLRDTGHDVVTAASIGLAEAGDADLLTTARDQHRIFVTRDRDFGGLVFLRNFGTGVIYLRISPSTQNAVHQELFRVLQEHSEEELTKAFVVVEPGRHRFRKLVSTQPWCHCERFLRSNPQIGTGEIASSQKPLLAMTG